MDSFRIEVPQIEIMIHHNMKMILLQQMASPVIFKADLMNIPKAMKRNIHLKTISHKLILTSKNQGTKIMHFCKFGIVPTKDGHFFRPNTT
jgi:hypothetical protein